MKLLLKKIRKKRKNLNNFFQKTKIDFFLLPDCYFVNKSILLIFEVPNLPLFSREFKIYLTVTNRLGLVLQVRFTTAEEPFSEI
jgi:hypothetical protein